MNKINTVSDVETLRKRLLKERKKSIATLSLCGGTGCQASNSRALIDAVKDQLVKQGVEKSVHVRTTGCHGFCEQGPIVVIEPGDIFYCHVLPDDAEEIVSKTVCDGEVIERLLYSDPVSGKRIQTEAEIPFYLAQDRQILAQNRHVDPCAIEDYIAIGGYSAECREIPGDEKYVICNADEGDPGAYMDRCVLEGNPHLVLEGMMIGAWAIGARQGYVYVRKEYPLALEHARVAVQQARELGFLGENVLGSSFSFDIEIARGGGAFVCGESTALIASLEGKIGEPRPKDVHTVLDGLWHRPTTLNNVETWANVPSIILNGSAWFASKGSNGSKGTKILALTGRIKNTGLVEVAMGTPLRNIIFDIGGGASNGNLIKAVQTGGPSGGCLPADKFDLPLDFDALAGAGSMVGSGGMVVMDKETCMVDVAKYFLTFLQDESCGKCVHCRLGIDRMLEIITDITEGRGHAGQISLLEELGYTLGETALCGLGKTAANPVLSTLRYFREEYEAHINQKQCPAGACQALITYGIDSEKCTGCGVCKDACPHEAIMGKKKQAHTIDLHLCQKCGICSSDCKFDAIQVN
jgi:NADH-quinone oxidoreductase subunit F